MSALLERYERQAVILDRRALDERIERTADVLNRLPPPAMEIPDLLTDMRVPVRVRDQLLRSRELQVAGVRPPRWAYGPFRQMIDGSICLANQTAITGTAETAMYPVAQFTGWSANQLRGGQTWYLSVFGICTTPGSGQGNLTITPRFGTGTGGTSLTASAATALAASASSAPWRYEYCFVVRSAAALAGTNYPVVGNGVFSAAVALITAATGNSFVLGSTASVNVDLTIAAGLFTGVTMGSASDSMVTMGLMLESFN